ncbi:MAG: glycosyltransferase [Thermoplasmata archaeon]
MKPGISLIVPAWNEEERIPATLARYVETLKSYGEPYEIIVVVDGVTDRTAAIARGMADQGVRVLEYTAQLGKGGAVVSGLAAARYDKAGYFDADAPVSPEDMHRLIRAVERVDCAIASRRMRGSISSGRSPLARRLFRVCFNILARVVLDLPFRDTQCGAKMFRTAAVRPVLGRVKLRGWAFDAAMLFELRRRGASFEQIPVAWKHDTGSKLPLAEQVPVMFLSVFFIRIVNHRVIHRLPPKVTWWFASNFMKRSTESTQSLEASLAGQPQRPFP